MVKYKDTDLVECLQWIFAKVGNFTLAKLGNSVLQKWVFLSYNKQILQIAESGVIGKIVEVKSANGDNIEVVIE